MEFLCRLSKARDVLIQKLIKNLTFYVNIHYGNYITALKQLERHMSQQTEKTLMTPVKASALAIALAMPVAAIGGAALFTMITSTAAEAGRGGATGDCDCGCDGPEGTPDRDGDGPSIRNSCTIVPITTFDAQGSNSGQMISVTQGQIYANIPNTRRIDPNVAPITRNILTTQLNRLTQTNSDGSHYRVSSQTLPRRIQERCVPTVETRAPEQPVTPTPTPTHTPAPAPSPIYTYDPNTVITTNPGATGACAAAFGVLSDIKRNTPSSIRVDPILRVGQDYTQFSAEQIESQNSCLEYGVVDRNGRACNFDLDDPRAGELFAEGGVCPSRHENTPEPEAVVTPEPETTGGECVAVVAHEKGLRNDGDAVIASWENPNDNSIFTVEHNGLNDVIGFDCDNDPELEYFATMSVDVTDTSSLLTKNEDDQYVGITTAVPAFELVKEQPAPAAVCPQTLENMCTGAGFAPRTPVQN